MEDELTFQTILGADAMSEKPLSRRLNNEMTCCPLCGACVQIRTLAYTHKCRFVKTAAEKAEEEAKAKDKLLSRVRNKFIKRTLDEYARPEVDHTLRT